jgi:hypothetical protein
MPSNSEILSSSLPSIKSSTSTCRQSKAAHPPAVNQKQHIHLRARFISVSKFLQPMFWS